LKFVSDATIQKHGFLAKWNTSSKSVRLFGKTKLSVTFLLQYLLWAGVGNLFIITGRVCCGISLAGRKNHQFHF